MSQGDGCPAEDDDKAQDFNKLNYLRLLRGANLTHAQYRVLVTMLSYSDRKGANIHPGFTRLREDGRMSRGTVSKCIAQLKKSGWLWEVSHGWPSKVRRKASVYELRVPPYYTLPDCFLTVTHRDNININTEEPLVSSDEVWKISSQSE